MGDVVVTVPKDRWPEWLDEGDRANSDGEPAQWWGEMEYGFIVSRQPKIELGERVYIVAHGKLRGYAPLIAIERGAERFGGDGGSIALIRRGGAVACTLATGIRGFQGWRYRWWDRAAELPFPEWAVP
jgi:hypothetical protein